MKLSHLASASTLSVLLLASSASISGQAQQSPPQVPFLPEAFSQDDFQAYIDQLETAARPIPVVCLKFNPSESAKAIAGFCATGYEIPGIPTGDGTVLRELVNYDSENACFYFDYDHPQLKGDDGVPGNSDDEWTGVCGNRDVNVIVRLNGGMTEGGTIVSINPLTNLHGTSSRTATDSWTWREVNPECVSYDFGDYIEEYCF